MRLRPLTLDDVPEAGQLTAATFGGGPRQERLRRYLALEPDGWFAAEDGGTLVGIGGVVCYSGFAWLGLMAVRPDRQRQGIGRAIAVAAIDRARAHGCGTIVLIARDEGIPLYRKLGFEPDGDSQEMSGVASSPPTPGGSDPRVGPWTACDTAEVARFDAPAFGANRERVLSAYAREFAGSAWVARDAAGTVRGFVLLQGESLGPWSAADDAAAGALLDAALAGVHRPIKVGVCHPDAERLLLARGLARTRVLPRMRLGPPLRAEARPRVLAHASYAVG
jgi:predicted N-acetyltransferase YhbS